MAVALELQCVVTARRNLETEAIGVSEGDGDGAVSSTLDEAVGSGVTVDGNQSELPEGRVARRWAVGVLLVDEIHELVV